MKNLFALLVVFGSLSLYAQEVDYQRAYLNGKAFYKEGKYSLAMEAFKPVLTPADGNPFAAYGSFYYALSAYYQNYLPLCRDMLLQIKQQHPKWNQLDEVSFWLAKVYFELGEPRRAVAVTTEVKDTRKFGESLEAMVVSHLSSESDLALLEELHLVRPNDRALGELLADKIAALPLVDQDSDLLARLIAKFKLDKTKYFISEGLKSEKRDLYHVAVMLPLMHKTLSPQQQRRSNQFVLDLYEGIRMAVDSLNKKGERIKLHVYDTERDAATTAKILNLPEMKSMDLFIGPLFPEPRKLVFDFCLQNSINMVNPLSQNSEFIGNNPFSFLYSASNETIGRNTATYIAENITNKHGIIFHGPSKQDFDMAKAFKEEIDERGYNIVAIQRIPQDDQRKVLDMLTSRGKVRDMKREDFSIKPDSIGYVFVASEDNMLASQVLSAAVIRGDTMAIFGPERWLEQKLLDLESMERQRIYLYSGNYFNIYQSPYIALRNALANRLAQPPTKFMFQGFDVMYFAGRSLIEYGTYWQHGYRDKGPIAGYLSGSYDYTKSNDNAAVVILRMRDNQLRQMNTGRRGQ
jgi:hypothetical protein